MFYWVSNMIASLAYNVALNSAGCASIAGMHQPKEPSMLKEAVEKNMKNKK